MNKLSRTNSSFRIGLLCFASALAGCQHTVIKDKPIQEDTSQGQVQAYSHVKLVDSAWLEPVRSKQEEQEPTATVGAEAVPIWKIKGGITLRTNLEIWSRKAAYTVVWDYDRDYKMIADGQFSGSFRDAVKDLFSTLVLQGVQLQAVPTDNNVLLIQPLK